MAFDRRFVKFLLVGALNTTFGYSVYAGLLFVGAHFTVAALTSTVLGVLFNFHTTGRLVFDSRDHTLLFRFVAVYAFLYGLNILLLKLMNLMSINYYLAGALGIPVSAVVGFLLMRRFVFIGPMTGH